MLHGHTRSFFVSFETSGGSYNPSQNILRLINECKKCVLSFPESLIADFIRISGTISKFLFLQERLDTRLCGYSILWCKNYSFSKSFDNSWGNCYVQYIYIYIYKLKIYVTNQVSVKRADSSLSIWSRRFCLSLVNLGK